MALPVISSHTLLLRWWVGGWQQCSATCGSDGIRKRTVLCVRTVSGEERVLHPVECKHLLKPKPIVPCNRDVACGQDWAVGVWGQVFSPRFSVLLFHSKFYFSYLTFSTTWMQCPVTCGGGVRSRTVTCAVAAKKTCDPATKPRSRSLCALLSCPNSGLQRRPGPVPKYRRIFPPKNPPTRQPPQSTWDPRSAATSATPTTSVTVMKTTAEESPAASNTTIFPVSKTTMSEIADIDDEFSIHSRKNDKGVNGFPSKADDSRDEREEEEDGSTPNMAGYTPGYDYVVEDRMTEEEGIIDLDVTTSAPFRIPLQSTPPTSFGSIARTLQTGSTTMFASKPPTASTSSHSTAKTWTETTHHYPVTTRPNDPYSQWTRWLPLATTSVLHATQPPSTTARRPFTTAGSPRSTKKIIKVKKTAVTRKKNSSTPHPKKSTSSRLKSQSQEPDIPPGSPATDQTNPMHVSVDIFWVAGNWSEVGA